MLSESAPFPNLILLKLGGSLITDKAQPNTPRLEVIKRLASELSDWMNSNQKAQIILGHGSGSFGHVPAKEYGTRSGVDDEAGWTGFIEVWQAAAKLNHIVIDCLRSVGLPALAIPPSAVVTASNTQVARWDLAPVISALRAGLLPVVYGDVAFDEALRGTILSTEDLFSYLAIQLAPERILLAGLEPGVWEDYPQRSRIVREITPSNYARYFEVLKGSHAVDVTGGMDSKVSQNLELIKQVPGLEVVIFSGSQPGTLAQVLNGTGRGTTIKL